MGTKNKITHVGDIYSDPTIQDIQTQESPAPTAPNPQAPTAKVKPPLTVEITCIDCGATRTIGKGEVFQVKRCEACQAKHRKSLRKQYRKDRKEKGKNRIALLEALLRENGVAVPA